MELLEKSFYEIDKQLFENEKKRHKEFRLHKPSLEIEKASPSSESGTVQTSISRFKASRHNSITSWNSSSLRSTSDTPTIPNLDLSKLRSTASGEPSIPKWYELGFSVSARSPFQRVSQHSFNLNRFSPLVAAYLEWVQASPDNNEKMLSITRLKYNQILLTDPTNFSTKPHPFRDKAKVVMDNLGQATSALTERRAVTEREITLIKEHHSAKISQLEQQKKQKLWEIDTTHKRNKVGEGEIVLNVLQAMEEAVREKGNNTLEIIERYKAAFRLIDENLIRANAEQREQLLAFVRKYHLRTWELEKELNHVNQIRSKQWPHDIDRTEIGPLYLFASSTPNSARHAAAADSAWKEYVHISLPPVNTTQKTRPTRR